MAQWNEIISELEKHPASVAIGICILGIIGFFLKRKFFPDKSQKSTPSIRAGGSISAGGDITIGNETTFSAINIKSNVPRNLQTFERFLELYNWNKEIIEGKEFWICEHDTSYQIEIGEKDSEFSEQWTKVYLDSYGSWKTCVYLSIGGNRIKQLIFVAMDGGRIFVPLPERVYDGDKLYYFWERKSLAFKVSNIIGQYDIYNSIEGIAGRSKIEIKN